MSPWTPPGSDSTHDLRVGTRKRQRQKANLRSPQISRCVVKDRDRWPPCVGRRQGLSEAPGERPGWDSNPAAQPCFRAQRCIARTLVADPWPRARHQDRGKCRRLCSLLPGLLSACLSVCRCPGGSEGSSGPSFPHRRHPQTAPGASALVPTGFQRHPPCRVLPG